ncbi:MAG TPA: hypothetical protein VN844_15670 [Pyrinomonadaceae bacterium]|nr:hypothetical protein [Pyrinomonadaceae bacterium]
MSRILTLTLTTFAVFLLATNLTVTGSGQQVQNQGRPITPEEHDAMMLKAMAVNIRSVAKILKDAKIDLDAELFFTSRGRRDLSAQLEKVPAMQSAKFHSAPLRGVVMADSLTFAEKLPIGADTVVIARQIIFSGKAPVIKGPHELHIFALNSVSAANGNDTVITIDTSGEGVKYVPVPAESQIKVTDGSVSINTSGGDGEAGSNASAAPGTDAVAGSSGNTGQQGRNGTPGKPGACAENNAGGIGGPGADGLTGEDGGNGTKGKDGTDAHNQTIMIPNTDSPYFQLVAKGGRGSDGGKGGRAGDGGRGGNGGTGGLGIGCQCIANGVGDGGAGGPAGSGGAGGVGGRGGDGGDGGKAGNFAIFIPPRNYDMSHLRTFGGSGRGGRGGSAGSGGVGGQAGTPGSGGAGGNFTSCYGRNGTSGAVGNPGEPGRPGAPGDWGDWGAPGSLSVMLF